MYYSSPARRAFRRSPAPLPITKSNCEQPPRLSQSCQCQIKWARRENTAQNNSTPFRGEIRSQLGRLAVGCEEVGRFAGLGLTFNDAVIGSSYRGITVIPA